MKKEKRKTHGDSTTKTPNGYRNDLDDETTATMSFNSTNSVPKNEEESTNHQEDTQLCCGEEVRHAKCCIHDGCVESPPTTSAVDKMKTAGGQTGKKSSSPMDSLIERLNSCKVLADTLNKSSYDTLNKSSAYNGPTTTTTTTTTSNCVVELADGDDATVVDEYRKWEKAMAERNRDVKTQQLISTICADVGSGEEHPTNTGEEKPKLFELFDKTSLLAVSSSDSDDSIELVVYKDETQMADIMRLITRDLSEPYSIYTYRYFIHNWPHLCFLARNVEGAYIGAIVCKLSLHARGTRRGYIAMLAVDEKYRRQKIGTKLVSQAIEAMIQQGCDEVVLETEVTNRSAMKLYENLGFARDKRLFRYYLNGVDAFRLKLWLKPPQLVHYL